MRNKKLIGGGGECLMRYVFDVNSVEIRSVIKSLEKTGFIDFQTFTK